MGIRTQLQREAALRNIKLATQVATKHGMYKTLEYVAWDNMKRRCNGRSEKDIKNYVERNIKIYPPWINNFISFYIYIGEKPEPKNFYSLDRYPDNDGNYEPGNVRWATIQEQNQNKRFPKPGHVCRESKGGCGKELIIVRQFISDGFRRKYPIHVNEFVENIHLLVSTTPRQFGKYRNELEVNCTGNIVIKLHHDFKIISI